MKLHSLPILVVGIAVTAFGCGKKTTSSAKTESELKDNIVISDTTDNKDKTNNLNIDDSSQQISDVGKVESSAEIPNARAMLEIIDADGNIVENECVAYFIEMDGEDNSETYTSKIFATEAHCIVTSNPPLAITIGQKHKFRNKTRILIRLSTGALLENNPILLMDKHTKFLALDNRHDPNRLKDGIYMYDIALVLLQNAIKVKVSVTTKGAHIKPRWLKKYEATQWFTYTRDVFASYDPDDFR